MTGRSFNQQNPGNELTENVDFYGLFGIIHKNRRFVEIEKITIDMYSKTLYHNTSR